jgi:hypothetical protein
MIANLIPSWGAPIPRGVLQGLGASVLWTAQGKWSGPRPGGLTLRLRGSWGTEVRGWPPAIPVLTRLAACESVSAKAKAKRKTDIV